MEVEGQRTYELFDLGKDLSEKTDLAKKYPKVVSELTENYNKWLEEMADPLSNHEKRWKPSDAVSTNNKSKEKKKAARVKSRESNKKSLKP